MNGAIIRGRCKCYDYDKKLSKYSLNLEKIVLFKIKYEPSHAVRND